MKKEAVWGAAAPRMRTMLAGLLTNSCTWLKKLPARKVAKKMVSTCAGAPRVMHRVPAKHLSIHHAGAGARESSRKRALPQGRLGACLGTPLLVQGTLIPIVTDLPTGL